MSWELDKMTPAARKYWLHVVNLTYTEKRLVFQKAQEIARQRKSTRIGENHLVSAVSALYTP